MHNLKITFFGTPEFSVKILERMKEAELMPSLIVTVPDKPKGRGMKLTPPPTKIWAEENSIKVIQPKSLRKIEEADLTELKANADLFIVASYGKIIPKDIIDIPTHQMINVHPSLLPKHRGTSPIQTAILEGDKVTGVAIMLIDEEMDHGPILKISNLPPKADQPRAGKSQISNLYFKDVENQLAELGGKLLIEVISPWIKGEITPQEQDHSKATFTKKIAKEDGLIDWSEPVKIIDRKIRAFTPWPGAYFFTKEGERIIITQAQLKEDKLVIQKIKPEGKKEMELKSSEKYSRMARESMEADC